MDCFKIHGQVVADYCGYIERFINISGDQIGTAVEKAHTDLLQLRTFHIKMDETVLAAYDWEQCTDAGRAIALRHDFYEVNYLPENDRVRYTIHPNARKEILKRLLQLNHKLYAEEESKGLHKKKAAKQAKAESEKPQAQQQLI